MYQQRDFHIPYIAHLSPLLRLAAETTGIDIADVVEGVISDIVYNEEVATSLKQPPPPGTHLSRQVDVTNKEGQIFLKCFVSWKSKDQIWVVCIEGGFENWYEKKMVGNG